MSDTTMNDLVVNLKRSKRRWKALALGLLAVLGLVIVFGTGMSALMAARARMQEDAARAAELEAHRAAEQKGKGLRIPGAEK